MENQDQLPEEENQDKYPAQDSVSQAEDGLEPINDQLTAVQSESMIEEADDKPTGWYSGIGGALLSIILVGPVLGLLYWWVWGRSPLVTWVRVGVSLLPIIILIIII